MAPQAKRPVPEAAEKGAARDAAGSASCAPSSAGVWVEPLDLGGDQLWVLSYETEPRGALQTLTQSELDVVRSVLQGQSNREIARARGCAVATVSNHLAAVYQKLGVHSRSELASHVLGQVGPAGES